MDKYNSLKVGDSLQGYNVTRVESLESINTIFYELEHPKSGARHIHLSSDDTNNMFGVVFKTTPQDSTGIAHILEHTVLCGSEKFPVRDPFFSMIRRSLNTFMNAFTSSDWTMYPFSSQNEPDFYNLLDIYLDAAFFPNIYEIDFAQEGHRFEFEKMEDINSPLNITGVVYNEMKGAMSSAPSVMQRRMLQALYPTITYGHNSGGEPENIPELTYEAFVEFHKTHYHPSNGYFVTAGNMPLEKHLTFINEKVLSRFDKIEQLTVVPDEKRYTEPKSFSYTYPLNKSDDDGAKNTVGIYFLANKTFDMEETLSMKIVEEILFGHAGAPLNKALMESGLGKSLAVGTGYDSENRETVFGAGLDGVSNENIKKIEPLVLDTLKSVVESGVSEDALEAAIHQLEISTRQVTGDRYPQGILHFFKFSGAWLHDGDPVQALDFDRTMKEIRNKMKNDSKYFENIIEKYLLNNPHRVEVILSPDHEQEAREKAKLRAHLDDLRSKMSDEEANEIVKNSLELKARQEMEEDLSCLPIIAKEDLTRETPKIEKLPTVKTVNDVETYLYEQPVNGLSYATDYFNLSHLADEQLVKIPVFCSLLTQCGYEGTSYDEVGELLSLYTGGVSAGVKFSHDVNLGGSKNTEYLYISGKSLNRNLEKMLELKENFINRWTFNDLDRIRTVIKRKLNYLEQSILNSGHGYALNLAARGSSKRFNRYENLEGVHQLEYLRKFAAFNDEDLLNELESLSKVGKKIFSRNNMRSSLCTDTAFINELESSFVKYLDKLPSGGEFVRVEEEFTPFNVKEAWTTTTPVSYVVKSFVTPSLTHEDGPKLAVLAQILRAGYLHPEIREKGGAYGGMCSYNPYAGEFAFMSYRDPHFKRTCEVYDGVMEYLESGKVDQSTIDEIVVSIFGTLDTPSSPVGNSSSHFADVLNNMTYELHQKYRDGIFNTTVQDLLDVAKKYLLGDYSLVGITSDEILTRDEVTGLDVKNI